MERQQATVGQTPRDAPSHDSATGEREWTNSMWDCFEPADLCCLACFCPCVLFGKTHQRLEDPTLKDYKAVNGCCVAQCCLNLAGLAWLLPMNDRAEMRRRYGLKGSGFDDFARTCCCGGIVLLQHEKEAILLTQDGAQQPNNQGFQSQPGMSYTTEK